MIIIKKAKKHPQIRVRVCCVGVIDVTPNTAPQCNYIAVIAVSRTAILEPHTHDYGRCPSCRRPIISVPAFPCQLKDAVDRVEQTLAASKREELRALQMTEWREERGYPAPVLTVDAPKFVHTRCNSAVVANEQCDFVGIVALTPYLPNCPKCGRDALYQLYGDDIPAG